ncbi:allene oxide cyclase family protein [Conexibacter woesei]|uniref:allene oxide cyclase family protein n=1 Tax=Conexibacter woesei TaxID=191495 RepID=UPI000478FCE3|nr:allene oxide cyclase family protein [Conexibacter woesei]
MRRLVRLPLPLVAACAIVLALSAVAFAHGNNADGHGPKHGVKGGGGHGGIAVIEHADTDATTDTGASGDSAGDVLTFANPVFDAQDRTQVATDQGYCIRTVAGSAYECNWTTFLPKGQLVVEGPFYDTKDSTLAITGGTGAYKNARGTMDLHALDGGKRYAFTFHVVG